MNGKPKHENAKSSPRPPQPQKHAAALANPASFACPPPKPSRLSPGQKFALIGGAVILVLVLGFLLFMPSDNGTNPAAFSKYLLQNPKSGIIMDASASPDPNITSKIMQCGVNLIQSPNGFYKTGQKDLLIYSCNLTGCVSSSIIYNETNVSISSSNRSISLADALAAMRGRAYFHIKYGPDGRKVFYPNYCEVDINGQQEATCSITVGTQ